MDGCVIVCDTVFELIGIERSPQNSYKNKIKGDWVKPYSYNYQHRESTQTPWLWTFAWLLLESFTLTYWTAVYVNEKQSCGLFLKWRNEVRVHYGGVRGFPAGLGWWGVYSIMPCFNLFFSCYKNHISRKSTILFGIIFAK